MLKPISDFSLRNHWLHLIFIILTRNLPKLVINTAKVDFKHPIYSGNLPQTLLSYIIICTAESTKPNKTNSGDFLVVK